MGYLARFQFIDRRIIYVCVFVLVFGALIVPFRLPTIVSPEVESFYNEIENTPDNKVVLIGADWGAGTRAENRPQIAAVIEHLLIKKKKFIILGFAQQGPEFTLDLTEELAKRHGRKYGEDFCSFGFKPAIDPTLLSLGQSFKGTFKIDVKGTPTAQIPMMKNVNSMADVHLIAEVTGSGFMESYLRRVTKPTKIAQGCTGIIGPEQYAYLDSGQLVGLMVGMKGAAEYESKLRQEHPEAGVDPHTKKQLPGDAMIAMRPQSLAHLFIILLIILGNISVYLARKQAKQIQSRDGHGAQPVTNDELKEPLRQEPADSYAQLRTAMEVLVVLILLGVALLMLLRHRDSMAFSQRLVACAGAICTLAILSVLYKENAIYRLFEHIFIGLGAGYGVVITWREVLEPEWWMPLKAGGWYWLIPMLLALLYYTVYSKKYAWMSRLLVSTLFGVAAGQAFQGFAAQILPQVSKSFKPLWGTGVTLGDSFNNFIFVATLVCVLVYFFFSYRQDKPAVRGVATGGRWLMMIAFGAVFGSTVMGRFSLFIGRAQFLLNDWLGVPRQ